MNNEVLATDKPLRGKRGIAALPAERQKVCDFVNDGEETWHGFKRAAAIIGIQTSDDHAFAEIRELGANIHYLIAKELRFVDADDLRARRQLFHDFGCFEHAVRRNAEARMRHDFGGSVAFVDGRLEDLHALARELRATQAAAQLLPFAGKNRAHADFDPAHIAFYYVHGCSLKTGYPFSILSLQ